MSSGNIYTSKQVAEMLGTSHRSLLEHALKNNIGEYFNPRLRVYSDSDVEKLRPLVGRKPGRPKKVADAQVEVEASA